MHDLKALYSLKAFVIRALSIVIISSPGFAQELIETKTVYQVEVVVFEQLYMSTDEDFTVRQGLSRHSSTKRLVDFTPLTANQTQLLAQAEQLLNNQAASIRRSRQYRLLDHLSWITELEDNRNMIFRIPTVTDLDDHKQLEGTIRVRRSRFLQVKPDLLLTKWDQPAPNLFDEVLKTEDLFQFDQAPVASTTIANTTPEELADSSEININPAPGINAMVIPEFDPINPETPTNPLAEMGLEPLQFYKLELPRRMRSNEIHYFDHPAFGMIAMITPIEIEIPIEPEETLTEKPIPAETPGSLPVDSTENPQI